MTIGVLGSFLLDWFAVFYEWRKIKPITKILSMFMLILWTLWGVDWSPYSFVVLLLIAQFFCLMGDTFLLLSDHWFFAGLGAFLLGHLFYLMLIFLDLSSASKVSLQHFSLLPIIISVIIWGVVLFIIYKIFDRDYFIPYNKGKILWTLLQVYIWILSGLMALAVFRVLIQPNPVFLMALLPIGGMLFLISDSILAYDRFVKPIANGQLWVHVTYHLAQFSIACGFLSILEQL